MLYNNTSNTNNNNFKNYDNTTVSSTIVIVCGYIQHYRTTLSSHLTPRHHGHQALALDLPLLLETRRNSTTAEASSLFLCLAALTHKCFWMMFHDIEYHWMMFHDIYTACHCLPTSWIFAPLVSTVFLWPVQHQPICPGNCRSGLRMVLFDLFLRLLAIFSEFFPSNESTSDVHQSETLSALASWAHSPNWWSRAQRKAGQRAGSRFNGVTSVQVCTINSDQCCKTSWLY